MAGISFDSKFIKFSVPVASSTLLTGLICYYNLDEASGTIVDSVNGYNSTTETDLTYQSVGKIDYAITFNGTSSIIILADQAAWDVASTDEYSMSAWIYMTGTQGAYMNIFGDYDGPAMYMSSEGGGSYSLCLYQGGDEAISTPGTFNNDTWYHVMLTKVYDNPGYTVSFYQNNVLLSAETDLLPASKTPTRMDIGSSSGSEWFEGRLCDIAYWSKVLSSNERTELYNGGTGNRYPFT